MMQECPRCGFLQPQDRFCANCGLDIENYRPTPTPWYRQLVLNSTFQVSAIVLTIGAMVAYIAWQQSQRIDQAPSPQFVADDNPNSDSPSEDTRRQKEPASKTTPQTGTLANSGGPSDPTKAAKAKGSLPTTLEGDKATGDDKTKTKPNPTNLVVRFAEVPREALNQFFSEAQILHEGAQVQVGAYTFQGTIEDLVKKTSQARFLPGNGKGPLTGSGVRVQYTKPLGENSEELQGLNFEVTIASFTPAGIEIETSGGFYLSGAEPDQTINITLDGSYTLDYSSILLIAGIVPHRPFSDKEAPAFDGSPIAIMNSQEFLANETEFVLLLQAN